MDAGWDSCFGLDRPASPRIYTLMVLELSHDARVDCICVLKIAVTGIWCRDVSGLVRAIPLRTGLRLMIGATVKTSLTIP